MLRWLGKKGGMYGMTDMKGLVRGLWSVGVMGMMMSSWSHTWKAFGCEWVRAGGMFRGLTPSGALLSLVRSSSSGPSKQSEDMKTHLSPSALSSHTVVFKAVLHIITSFKILRLQTIVSLLLHLHPVTFKGLWTEPQGSRYVNGD